MTSVPPPSSRILAPIVLVDMDDTIADLERAVFEYMYENHGDKGWFIAPNDRDRYAISAQYDERFGDKVGDIVRDFEQKPGFFFDLRPVPGAIDALKEMEDEGIDVRFCSTPYELNPASRDDKARWIKRYFWQGDSNEWARRLILTRFKAEQAGEILIDDSTHLETTVRTTWKQVFRAKNYNTGHEPRLEDWAHWREAVYPILREKGFEMIAGRWGQVAEPRGVNVPSTPSSRYHIPPHGFGLKTRTH